jgi:hypothetical protein
MVNNPVTSSFIILNGNIVEINPSNETATGTYTVELQLKELLVEKPLTSSYSFQVKILSDATTDTPL